MKLKLTNDQKRDFDKARFLFDIGNFTQCDEILKDIHPELSHHKLKWSHDAETKESKRAGAFIVTKPNRYLVEKDRIVLHETNIQAIEYGKSQDGYGFGHYLVLQYSKWKDTEAGKYHRRLLKVKARLAAFKQEKTKTIPPSEKVARYVARYGLNAEQFKKAAMHDKAALKIAKEVIQTPDAILKTQKALPTKREARDTIKRLKK